MIYIFSERFNSISAGIQYEAEGRGLRIGFVLILRQAIAYPSPISCLEACVALLQNFSHHASLVSTESTSSPHDMLSSQFEDPKSSGEL